MNRRYTNRRRGGPLPLVMLLMAVAVVVLVVTIALTGDEDVAPGSSAPTSTSVPSSEPPSSSASDISTPASDSSAPASDSIEPEPSSSESSSVPPSSASSAASGEQQDKYYEKDKPLLVNSTNKVPAGYSPKLEAVVDSYKLDARAAVAFKDMLAKAWQEDINLWVVSAYRSNDKQTINFNNEVKKYEGKGYTNAEAYAETAKWIAVPGTSEHETGLAVDINSLYTSFEDTKEYRWLMANCADFGFALRYPKDKVEVTQISYEPWHYRYVGSNHARVIMDKGICLEEYLSGTY